MGYTSALATGWPTFARTMLFLPPTLTLATLADLLRGAEPVRLAPEADWPLGPATAPAPGPGLLLACATGLGPELPPPLVRRLLLLKAYELRLASPGATPAAVRRLLDFYSRDVWPVVYAHGSVDGRAALAHLCLPLLGLGEVNYQGYQLAAADVLGLFGWEPLTLRTPAEAAALLGGQTPALAYATEALARTEALGHAAALLALGSAPASELPAPAPAVPPARRQLIEEALLASPLPLSSPAAAPAPSAALAHALAQVAETAAALAVASARRTAALVAGLPAPAEGYGLLALPGAAAELAALAAPRPADAPVAAAAEALRVAEAAEQLLGLELLAVAQALDLQPAGARVALGPMVAAFRERVTFVAADRALAPDLRRATEFVRQYAWPASQR